MPKSKKKKKRMNEGVEEIITVVHKIGGKNCTQFFRKVG